MQLVVPSRGLEERRDGRIKHQHRRNGCGVVGGRGLVNVKEAIGDASTASGQVPTRVAHHEGRAGQQRQAAGRLRRW